MLELYYFENSICSERALMTLAEKGVTDWVAHHVHLFEGQQFNPEYLKLNPKAQVPTLVHDGEVIRESSVITDYLDDLYPEPPLKPSKLSKIAQMREWIKESDEAGFEGVRQVLVDPAGQQRRHRQPQHQQQRIGQFLATMDLAFLACVLEPLRGRLFGLIAAFGLAHEYPLGVSSSQDHGTATGGFPAGIG